MEICNMYYKDINGEILFNTFSKRYVNSIDKKSALNQLTINQINVVKERKNQDTLNLVVTITSECDLKCEYCFENHLDRTAMSIETCDELIRNIKNYIEKNGITNVDCILFGGEPMLNQGVLNHFTTELNSYCNNQNVNLSMLLTTNGIICDKSFFERLADNGVSGVQLSFDGTEKTNNRRRNAKDKACNPYREIMKNIGILLNIFNFISVKYNFDQDNCNEYKAFLQELGSIVGNKKNKITIILETINKTPFGEYGVAYDTAGKELAIQFVEMVKATIESGYHYATRIFISPCMHTATNSYMIDTQGIAYSCISSFGIEEFKIGKFSDSIYDISSQKRNEYTKLETLNKHCKDCCYVPLCWGGCAYVLKSAGKNIYSDIHCRKIYFNTIIETFYREITLKYGVDRIE